MDFAPQRILKILEILLWPFLWLSLASLPMSKLVSANLLGKAFFDIIIIFRYLALIQVSFIGYFSIFLKFVKQKAILNNAVKEKISVFCRKKNLSFGPYRTVKVRSNNLAEPNVWLVTTSRYYKFYCGLFCGSAWRLCPCQNWCPLIYLVRPF